MKKILNYHEFYEQYLKETPPLPQNDPKLLRVASSEGEKRFIVKIACEAKDLVKRISALVEQEEFDRGFNEYLNKNVPVRPW